jgi:riboflavin synthase
MFTGIIEAVGKLTAIERRSGGYHLSVDLASLPEPPAAVARRAKEAGTRNSPSASTGLPGEALAKPGDSVAVSGPCLTVATLEGTVATFDAVAETVSRTTLPGWRPGRKLNLERAVPAGGRLGGHFLTGHVDAPARVLAVRRVGEGREADFSVPAGCEKLVAEKGSVALDGVSLTVARLITDSSFRVALVPHTLGATTLADIKPGEEVNFEADILARYAARLLGAGGGLTEEKLREAGFI